MCAARQFGTWARGSVNDLASAGQMPIGIPRSVSKVLELNYFDALDIAQPHARLPRLRRRDVGRQHRGRSSAPLGCGRELDPWEKQRLDLLIQLDNDARTAPTGNSLVHADVHRPNLLVDGDQVNVIDWAWSRTGPPWVDAALLVIRLIAEGHDPADAERLVSGTWGMRHPSATVAAVTTFAANTYGQWRRLAVEYPSPHREGPVEGARRWTRHRLPVS